MIDEARLLSRFQALAAIDNPSGQERSLCDALTAALAALGIPAEEDGAGAALGGNAGNLFRAAVTEKLLSAMEPGV